MTKRVTTLLLTVLLVFLAVGRVQAESSPEARAWLEKMVSLYDRGPFSVHYSADMTVAQQQDQTMSMDMEGQMTHADPKHMRMDLSMNMTMPGAGAGSMHMKMLTVIDGETVWMDMDNPMVGGRKVMKMSYEQAEQSGSNMGLNNLKNMDPVSQMQEMMDKFDFQVVRDEGGKVVLSAPIDPEALAGMGQMSQMAQGQSMEDWEMVMVLDADKALPEEIRMGPKDNPVMTMRFTDWKFYGAAGAPAGTFEYTPPEGVQVMDLGAMQGGAPGGSGQ
jgi:outer membrane lipoprotein-sorting protein